MMKKYLLIVLCLAAFVFGINKKYIRPQPNTVDLVAYYKLWAGLTSTALVFDYSLNGNNGTVSNAIATYPGFSFDGTDDSIACGSGSTIDDIFVGGGTASLWLLSDGLGENNVGRAIGKDEWQICMITNTTTMRFQQNFNGDNGLWTFTITSGVWQHIAVVYDNDLSANAPVVYVNGVSTSVSEIQAPGAGDTDSSDAANNFIIGDSSASVTSWDGKIGEVMLYSGTKTATEIKSLYETTRWRYSK